MGEVCSVTSAAHQVLGLLAIPNDQQIAARRPGARVRPSHPSCRVALASWVAILVETDSAAARLIVNAELCWSKDRCPAAVRLAAQ